MDDLNKKIKEVLCDVAQQTGHRLVANFSDDTVLLQSGLDSLGFAIAVVRLEMELGYDPFRLMTEPVYPRTFRDFVSCYESLRPQAP
jgi:hypothetical protein